MLRDYHLGLLALGAAVVLAGCGTLPYHVTAERASNPEDVVVKVSLSNRAIYVLEGSRPLLVTATSIGREGKSTPTGSFRVLDKEARKRSSIYGFWLKNGEVAIGRAGNSPGSGWRYVGYPLAYWVHFYGDYGFHEGSIWPIPRTNGCLHLHANAASTFFELVRIGTPVIVARSLPEDRTLGWNISRPTDYRDKDRPLPVITTDRVFQQMPPPVFKPHGT